MKVKKYGKKIIAYVMVFIICVFIVSPPNEVKAIEPTTGFVISAVAASTFSSMFTSAGIEILDHVDLDNMIRTFAAKHPDIFREICEAAEAALSSDIIDPNLIRGTVVNFAKGKLSQIFDSMRDTFTSFFKQGTDGENGIVSTVDLNDNIYFINGFPIFKEISRGMHYGNAYNNPVLDTFNYYRRFCIPSTFNGNIGVKNYELYMIERYYSEGSYGTYNSLLASVNGDERDVFEYNVGGLRLIQHGGFYIGYSSGKYYLHYLSYGINSGSDTWAQIRMYAVSLEEVIDFGNEVYEYTPSFTASLNEANVITGSDEEVFTPIAYVLGVPSLDELDNVGIKLQGDTLGMTLEDVVTVSGEIVEPIDPPIDPPIETDNELLNWLTSTWSSLQTKLQQLQTTVATSTGNIQTSLQQLQSTVSSLPTAIANTLVGDGAIDFNKLRLDGNKLLTVFPFCIPFDFYNAIASLNAAPRAPVYTMDFSGTVMGDYKWTLDFSEYDSTAQIVRWCVYIGFLLGLIGGTHKFIKW